ncbi:MAG: bacteriohemerythrin [Gammaproteobacteria bacterium]|nr:bacteriohemerythrin [Gammaproteobacteria bacterium]MDH5735152.1 bacteriohemerythrin [Gammaproteobacteria bacterium]
MKDLIWDNALSVDVDEIDDDHRKLVELFNRLNHALENGDATNYVEAVLEELISCTIWHFRHEERLMLNYGYDGFEEHKAEHQSLIETANKMRNMFLQQGRQALSDEIEPLEHWLTGHILSTDMELGSFLGKVM